MGRGDYERLTPPAIDQVWIRMRAGHAAKPTALELGLGTSTVRDYLHRCGGIRPVPRRRASGPWSVEEREEISCGLAARQLLRSIAAGLGRAASTVGREIAANGGRGRYRAARAEQQAWTRATRPKRCKLAEQPVLRDIVAEKLRQRLSPQQIAGWLKTTYPHDPEMQVSHETIYRTLFIQSRRRRGQGADCSSADQAGDQTPGRDPLPDGRGGRPGIINISERPAEADDRAVPGHGEGDLVFGKHMTPVATLVERSTGS